MFFIQKGYMYDRNYAQWKCWDSDNFGSLSNYSINYFDAEFSTNSHLFNPKSNILEIGYGSGEFLRYAQQLGSNVIGLEKNLNLIESGLNAGFSCYEYEHIKNLPSSSLDLIVMFDVLEHLDSNELIDIFMQCNRLLKPNGLIFSRFPNGDSPLGMPYQNGDLTHKSAIGSFKINQLANMSGLRILSIDGEFEISRNRKFHIIFLFFVLKKIRALINLTHKVIFGGKNTGPYCSRNLVVFITKVIQ